MDTLGAFARGQMARAMGAGLKVFDWHKAARLIKESGAMSASAGLSGDWEWTGGEIFAYGKPLLAGESYTYLASTWATPELEIEGNLSEDCWCWQSEHPDWGSDTRWPQSALDILAGKEPDVVAPEPAVEPVLTEAQEHAVAAVRQHFENVVNNAQEREDDPRGWSYGVGGPWRQV